MNKTTYLLLPAAFALTGCELSPSFFPSKPSSSTSEIVEHDYREISSQKIDWNDMFDQLQNEYQIYFYSLTCAHCKNLKNKVIEYALKNDNFFFIEASEKVVIVEDVGFTIGSTSISEMGILGYPSLVKIEQKVCVFNVAGESEIISKLNL